jgi:hypothetical protein
MAGMDYAQKLFREAEDMRLNKKDPAESLPLYFTSIRLYPKGMTYLRYADALYAEKYYKTARAAYALSARDDKTLEGPGYLGQARCVAMLEDSNATESYLRSALESYPYDPDEIKSDKAFEKYINSDWYKKILANNIKDPRSRKAALFALFEKGFPRTALPYSIPLDSVYESSYDEIDPSYMQFIPDLSGWSPMGSEANSFEYRASFSLSPLFHTFLYSRSYYKGDTLNPVRHFLITLDQNDTMIAQQEIACACSPMTLRSGDISKDGIIEVKEYARTWDKDPLYYGYRNNKITSQTLKSTTRYQIMADGKITEIKEQNP